MARKQRKRYWEEERGLESEYAVREAAAERRTTATLPAADATVDGHDCWWMA